MIVTTLPWALRLIVVEEEVERREAELAAAKERAVRSAEQSCGVATTLTDEGTARAD